MGTNENKVHGTAVMQPNNIFAPVPASASGELYEQLLSGAGFRLERIVSTGQATRAGQWYDQETDEWVLLLSGAARLRFKSPNEQVVMKPGDYINIPAHRRHRVEWTEPERETVWLALYYVPSGQNLSSSSLLEVQPADSADRKDARRRLLGRDGMGPISE